MGVRIMVSRDGDECMYCSTTMWAFGPVLLQNHMGKDLDDFISWLPLDPRQYEDKELEALFSKWLAEPVPEASHV